MAFLRLHLPAKKLPHLVSKPPRFMTLNSMHGRPLRARPDTNADHHAPFFLTLCIRTMHDGFTSAV